MTPHHEPNEARVDEEKRRDGGMDGAERNGGAIWRWMSGVMCQRGEGSQNSGHEKGSEADKELQ